MGRFAVGIACALGGACLWGFSGTCSQFLLHGYDVTPMFMTMVRMIGAGIVFVAIIAWRHRDALREIAHDRRLLRKLLVFGAAGLMTSQLTYVVSVYYTNAGTATVLQSASIIFVMLATCCFERRRPGLLELLGLVCAVAATVFIATKGDLGALNLPPEGLAWGIANAATVAFYIMYPRKLFARFGSLPVTGGGMMLGGLTMAVLWCLLALASTLAGEGSPLSALAAAQLVVPTLDAAGVAVFALLILVGTLGAFGLYLHGVSIVGGVRGSMLGAAEPVSATVIAAVWLSTLFTWADWIGLALMVATIFLVALQPSKEA